MPPAEPRFSRVRAWPWALIAGCVALNLAMFLPSYLLPSGPTGDFWPFFPAEHPRGPYAWNFRGAWEYGKALTVRRANGDIFRCSAEVALGIGLVLATARWRWGKVLRWVLSVGCIATLLFLSYHVSFERFFGRKPAVWQDARLSLNLMHYLGDHGALRGAVGALAALLGAVLAVVGVRHLFEGLAAASRLTSDRTRSRALAACLLASLAATVSTAWFGARRDDPVFQWVSKRMLWNLEASRENVLQARADADLPVDRRYDRLMEVKLATRPNVFLVMVEAYGELLSRCDLRPAYQALMTRVEERLARIGYGARSGWSRAPVHGGLSWLSISTVQTGIRISDVGTHERLEQVAARIPSLPAFFKENGYRTVTFQPGNRERVGLKRFDLFARDEVFQARELEYRGEAYGWGEIPDQYSLGILRERVATTLGDGQPRFVFFMSVSTHHDWSDLPPYVKDWRGLQDHPSPPESVEGWLPLEEAAEIGAEDRAHYFRSIEYDWRSLLDLLEDLKDPDAVVIVVGDHQPRLDCPKTPKTYDTPLHVLSRDAAFVDSFDEVGLVRGMFPSQNAPSLAHEGMFSLLVEKLAQRHAGPQTRPRGLYIPEGSATSALNR
jgi:hypothetical protein